ncbi:MAG: DNA/RNA nuclease SfsA [Candidatus Methanomethyliales bacterium]|nr:DNA/RNA nuclease SfsA [Candidatus Methanomethylicales archaeon]
MPGVTPLLEVAGKIQRGIFISRPNRFTVLLEYQGRNLMCHLHDPGRLRELLIPGAPVLFREAQTQGTGRKTQYDVLAVHSSGNWVITDSRMPNSILKRTIELSILDYEIVAEEVKHDDSRIDFLLERDGVRYITEVKGCTLCRDGIALFPDAPTSRGSRQIKRMLEYPGARPLLVFVIMRPDALSLSPNVETDPKFYEIVREGIMRGLATISFKVSLEDGRFICFRGAVPVVWDDFSLPRNAN